MMNIVHDYHKGFSEKWNGKNRTAMGIHRLNLERLNLEWDFCPNGLNPEWDFCPNGLNPEWDSTPNGLNTEMDST